ncbi:ankyrin repeat domain-containing protein [Streptomyces canus]|uniref:ankyrin repeat domain-containing protein n=1 Tax=Streptomyces canus TaxID=58343 RepID=UPI002DD822C4|nr:ankyrin repeat domain-containing protein [Streptomyces canus]
MQPADSERYEMSPVHVAVETDDLAELTRLLDAGADPDEFDGYSGWTPLLHAIDREADGAVQTGKPLQAACTAVLLAYGADPERPSRDGLTPLHLAFQSRHDMAVRLIEAHTARRHAGE